MKLQEQLQAALAPHIEPLQQRWEQMPRTDQLVWGGVAGLSILVVLVFGIWLPSHRAAVEARTQYENNQGLLSYIQANAGHVQPGGSPGVGAGEPLLSVISSSASSNGFSLRRFEPEGERVHIWLDGVPFNKVAGWLDQLSKQGITTVSAEVEKQDGPGLVMVNVTLGR